MPALATSAQTETVLRDWLPEGCYNVSRERRHGETGCDIAAETIAYKKSDSARAKDFLEVSFRAVSRLRAGDAPCAIALAERAGHGLPKRAAQHGMAWRRIGDAFPEPEVWLVDTDQGSVCCTRWNDRASGQRTAT